MRGSWTDVKPFKVRLRFHGDLDFFLRIKPPSTIIERTLSEKTAVKDIIESCGVPHPEVDLILVDGCAIEFDETLASDTQIDVYPVAVSDPPLTEKRLHVTCANRFVVDGHLGKLARNLRLLGFDVAYDRDAYDRQLLDIMTRENRVLLTRDRRLLMHSVVHQGYYPRSQNAEEQTVEVIRRFKLRDLIAPFMRCLRCNAPLKAVAKIDIIEKLEPLTKFYYRDFRRCAGCGQIYWAGSHFTKLQKRLETIQSRLPRW